jgi:hypothetical protein
MDCRDIEEEEEEEKMCQLFPLIVNLKIRQKLDINNRIKCVMYDLN